VYRALDRKQSRMVAVKCLRPEFIPKLLEMFRAEACIGTSLQHDCICRVYDSYFEGAVPYIIMEYVSGVRLDSFIRRQPNGRCDQGLFRHLTMQLLDAIEYIHDQMYVHRDLRTWNILVTHELNIKVIDFGIAAEATESPDADDTLRASRGKNRLEPDDSGLLVGAAICAADEFEVFQRKQISFSLMGPLRGSAIDLHCLGCVLYEMLSGAILCDIVEDCGVRLYPPPPEISAVGRELNAIIVGCLLQDDLTPMKTAADVREALNGNPFVITALKRWKRRILEPQVTFC
jgi:serine/threonine protein kinase